LIKFFEHINQLLLSATLGDFVAIIFGFFGLGLFKSYHREKRSAAAVKALATFQYFFDYIDEIALKPEYYEHLGYYPFVIPEIADKGKPEQYAERPPRPYRHLI